MKYGSLIFEKKDFSMIKKYRKSNPSIEDYYHKNTLEVLDENMLKAVVFGANKISSDIIQMYSLVTVTSASGELFTFQLVAPFEMNIKKKKVSVMSSLGASLIGFSEGDTIKFGLPSTRLTLKINEVKQSKKSVASDISEDNSKKKLRKQNRNSIPLNT